jgi:arsenite/tail-anchored protein-transporting ATPase
LRDSAAAREWLTPGRRRVLFVGGKGGVGKTTVAAALALRLADAGERCLLVSTDPAHSLGDLFDRSIGDTETELASSLWGMEIDPDAQVSAHLAAVKQRMRELVGPELYPEIDRQMDLARLSPGAVEAAMLERIADLVIAAPDRFDRILFDTAPTGHTLRLLALPEIMAAWTDGLLRRRDRADAWAPALKRLARDPGPGDDLAFLDPADDGEDRRTSRIREVLLERRRKFYQMRRILMDGQQSGFVLVLIPEKLPILESAKAAEALERAGVPVLGVVVNRVLPASPLGDFLEQRREQEGEYLRRIGETFASYPRVQVPLMSRDVAGFRSLRALGAFLLPDVEAETRHPTAS